MMTNDDKIPALIICANLLELKALSFLNCFGDFIIHVIKYSEPADIGAFHVLF